MSRRYFKLMMIGLLTLLICLWWGKTATAKLNPRQLVQQGVEQYQQGNVTTAIAFWQQALKIYHNSQIKHFSLAI